MSERENFSINIADIVELRLGEGVDNDGKGQRTPEGVPVTATADEINQQLDRDARVEELTVAGANDVTPGIQSLELNNDTTAIAATIADAVNHAGFFIVKATTEPAGGQDHTLTLTAGTFDGTNTIATFADINDALVVYFDSAGNGTIIENVGAVVLS